MKYLMGLIMSFTIGATAIAQDDNTTSASGKFRNERNNQMEESGSGSLDTTTSSDCVRFEDGSAEYYFDPQRPQSKEMNESSDASVNNTDAESQTESETGDEARALPLPETETESDGQGDAELNLQDTSDVSADAKGEMEVETEVETEIETDIETETADAAEFFDMTKQCSLHRELDNREGAFKIKEDLGNSELSVSREKDGDENVKYKSDTEYYNYEKDGDGKEEYVYSMLEGNEGVELRKNDDGSAEIMYQRRYNTVEEANQALKDGLKVENFSSVCR